MASLNQTVTIELGEDAKELLEAIKGINERLDRMEENIDFIASFLNIEDDLVK